MESAKISGNTENTHPDKGTDWRTEMNEKINLGLPDKLKLLNHGAHLEIVRKWFGTKTLFSALSLVFFGGFFYNFFYNENSAAHFPILFLIPYGAAVIANVYTTMTGLLNSTHIIIGQGKLVVRHKPIPWLGNKNIDTSNFKQLYSIDKIHRSKNGSYQTYEVHAITRDDLTIKLVTGLETSEQALYVEQEVEKFLGIEDIPVKGEIGSSGN
jgi:hypothetical protein